MIKKILFFTIILLGVYEATAQVNYFHGSLNEALVTAKKENKVVLIIGSTSWCGPCKNLAEKILTTPEAGDYMNPRLIVMKTILDKADPDSLAKKFDIKAYPTLVFLNSEGVEVSRKLGGASKTKDFITAMEKCLDSDLSFQAREKRLAGDPSYAVEYANYLNEECRMYDRANDVLLGALEERQSSDFYSDKTMKLIRGMSHNINSPILNFFIENKKKLCNEMGEQNYLEHMRYMGESMTLSLLSNKKTTDEDLRKVTKFMLDPKQKDLMSEYPYFVYNNSEIFIERNLTKTLELIEENYKKCSPKSGISILTSFGRFYTDEEKRQNIATFVKLFDDAVTYFHDEKDKTTITRIKTRFVSNYSSKK